MIDIEQILEQFDEYIDNNYANRANILGKEYVTSELLRNYDHKFYCEQLDEFIKYNFERIDDDFYRAIGGSEHE